MEAPFGSMEEAERQFETRSLQPAFPRWLGELEDGVRVWGLFVGAFDAGESVK